MVIPVGRHSRQVAELRRIVRGADSRRTVVDGTRLVSDLLRAGVPVHAIFTTRLRLASVTEALPATVAPTVPVYLLDEATASRLAPTQHGQGVLAVVSRPVHTMAAAGVVLYLDRIQDPGNVGGVIRSAAALGAAGVACSAGCADPFSPRALRASAGQALLLPVQYPADFAALVAAFAEVGGEAVGTSAWQGVPLPEWRPRPPVLVAFGNEGQGLSPDVAAPCAHQVTIPLARGVESLNVAVSAALVLAWLRWVVPSPILER